MTVHLRIHGQVQGVFFRRTAKAEAVKLGLTGWVRNNGDGSVEVLAVGYEKELKEFIKWCKDGPGMAKVDRVVEKWSVGDEDFGSFEVL